MAPRPTLDAAAAPGTVVALAAAGLLWVAAGLPGGLLGAALVVARLSVPAPYAFAAGQLGLAAVLPAGAPLEGVALAQAALLGVLLADALRADGPRVPAVLALLAAAAVLGGVVAVGYAAVPTPHLALGLAGLAGLGAYGIHRYELVRLGLVAGAEWGDSAR